MTRTPIPPAFWLATCAALALLTLSIADRDPPLIADLHLEMAQARGR